MSGTSSRVAKKLILCCDGTWQNSDNGTENGSTQLPSNATHFARAIVPADETNTPQIVYYQAGLGSNSSTIVDHLLAGVTGAGISENIREAYGFLASNYAAGDSIFLLGFSRGAYIARSVAGMIGGIGLLTKDGMRNFHECLSDFENAGVAGYKPKLPTANTNFVLKADPAHLEDYLDAYRVELSQLDLTREVQITAIGVWETVGALGIPVLPMFQTIIGKASFQEYEFYDTSLDNHISYAFQALALDETRATFVPTVWERRPGCTTKLKQCWFAGAHGNIGGGSNVDTSAGDISLAWMMSNLSPWIHFNPNYLHDQASLNHFYNESHKLPLPRWGCGPIYSPSSWWKIIGSFTRTPDLYHRTNYTTGMSLPEMLENTEERVHASVRARMKFGGKNADGSTTYKSPALKNWAMQTVKGVKTDPAPAHTLVEWVYTGKSKDGLGKIMIEDVLGDFELQLMDLVDPDAKTALLQIPGSAA